jgi:hypothetical protein
MVLELKEQHGKKYVIVCHYVRGSKTPNTTCFLERKTDLHRVVNGIPRTILMGDQSLTLI